jgi:hypothetical protein
MCTLDTGMKAMKMDGVKLFMIMETHICRQ